MRYHDMQNDINNFNSIKVRLERISGKYTNEIVMVFQFDKGTIRTAAS